MITNSDLPFLESACDLALESLNRGGFPCGCVVVSNQTVIGEGMSLTKIHTDPTKHAEMMAIQAATLLEKSTTLENTTLYSSLEPCVMCFHAAYWAGIKRIVYGVRKEMIHPDFYEGRLGLDVAEASLDRRLTLNFLPDFEQKTVKLIQTYRNKSG